MKGLEFPDEEFRLHFPSDRGTLTPFLMDWDETEPSCQEAVVVEPWCAVVRAELQVGVVVCSGEDERVLGRDGWWTHFIQQLLRWGKREKGLCGHLGPLEKLL